MTARAARTAAPARGAVERKTRAALGELDGVEGALAEATFTLARAVDNAEPSSLAPLIREFRLALAVFDAGRRPPAALGGRDEPGGSAEAGIDLDASF